MITDIMPLLFLGHGNPMNAIEENEFVKGFREVGRQIPRPRAILCISAHWETRGTFVTSMEKPRTIHDFGGFPKELYKIVYPAPGSPALARDTIEAITSARVEPDFQWGLDHGTWSVIKHIYPDASVPIVQLSLDYTKTSDYHYQLARELSPLRKKGVLIIGSGNMVHNLRLAAWDRMNDTFAYDWAAEADALMKKFILEDNHTALINYGAQGESFRLAIPTPEHYLPLLYILALKEKQETITLFNDKPVAGSMTMTSILFFSKLNP